MRKLTFGVDTTGKNAFAPYPSTLSYSATLVNGDAQSITVPDEAKLWTVAFSYQPGAIVWVDFSGATASVPAGSTFASTTSELNPSSRTLSSDFIPTISLITSNASTDVSVTFYVAGTNNNANI